MSLVAYAASSDDESDNENQPTPKSIHSVDSISDEEDPLPVTDFKHIRTSLNLPVPKATEGLDNISPFFGKLPAPKINKEIKFDVVEEDDEFLHKKATPLETPGPRVPSVTKNLVRITIPSLKDFDDVEDRKEKKSGCAQSSSFSSLISMLPQPKSEKNFTKPNKPTSDKKQTSLVPDTVKNRRPAQNTENVDRKIHKKPPPKPKATTSLVEAKDSDDSENEQEDFFSLNTAENLPEISADEITAMVSKKAAAIAQNSARFDTVPESTHPEEDTTADIQALNVATNSQPQLDKEAIQALMGSQAKRRKMDEIEIIEISGEQVLPNKDEWLRTALASATTYQATGVLADDEPAAGTRRKHQITYLAHKAKANEAELQAMWSANRQNRRQTQSKYGF